MSLMDTIKGARDEVGAGHESVSKKASAGDAKDGGAAPSAGGQGFTRKSASKARPSRQQAAGVRMVNSNGKNKKNLTKEEAKEERKHDRKVSDLRYNVTQKVLQDRAEYQAAHKLWMRLIIAGVVLMVAAVLLYIVVTNMGQDAPEALGIAGLVVMVCAYAVVIVALVYDWRKIRPMRRDVEKYVDSMSEKRLVTAINKEAKAKK